MSKCQRRRKPRSLMGQSVKAKPVTECGTLREVFDHCLPAFGGTYLRRVYQILREVRRQQVPLVIACAGPVTVSDQHRAWLIPLIRAGGVAYLSVTDAICYHDGHDGLKRTRERPIREVETFGDDTVYRKAGIIRVTNTGFPERVLFDQDRMISAMLQRPEFQRKMTTTERNFLMGQYYGAQEKAFGISPGLLHTCAELGVPVFVGAPADGSAFLNSVKLWALAKLDGTSYGFDYDLHADVFEACAYHYWGLFSSKSRSLAILILGGGVPKNYALQPEPTLAQIFLLSDIKGYDFDVQIVSAPVTDGSLSSCQPSEAVSWGKINPETYRTQTESLQADYSLVMPFIVKALLADPDLPLGRQLSLYGRRESLKDQLLEKIREKKVSLKATLQFPLKLREARSY